MSEGSDLKTTTLNAEGGTRRSHRFFRRRRRVWIWFADNKADSSAVTGRRSCSRARRASRRAAILHPLSRAARVVAIDLPGFGHSDGRPELIAPDAMGTFLARLIEEWGLGHAARGRSGRGHRRRAVPRRHSPDRVTSLTIRAGAVRFPIVPGGALEDVIEAPSLDAVRHLDARMNIGFAVEPGPVPTGARRPRGLRSAYDLGRFAESARFVRHHPEQNPLPRDLLPSITTPAQIIGGREDDLVPWSNNQYLADLLPDSETTRWTPATSHGSRRPMSTAASPWSGSRAVSSGPVAR